MAHRNSSFSDDALALATNFIQLIYYYQKSKDTDNAIYDPILTRLLYLSNPSP